MSILCLSSISSIKERTASNNNTTSAKYNHLVSKKFIIIKKAPGTNNEKWRTKNLLIKPTANIAKVYFLSFITITPNYWFYLFYHTILFFSIAFVSESKKLYCYSLFLS